MTDAATRWLDPEATARYLSVRPDALPRLVKAGRIPRPNYQLGARSPRWDRAALDAAFDGGTASTDASAAFRGLTDAIASEGPKGRPNRTPHAR